MKKILNRFGVVLFTAFAVLALLVLFPVFAIVYVLTGKDLFEKIIP
jgi:hypothetical protein